MARRKAPGPPSGADGIPPPELFDGDVVSRMVGFIEADDPAKPWGYAAFIRLHEAQRRWLCEHGYEGKGGHPDWSRFRRDHNRPVYPGGPRPRPTEAG